MNASLRNTGMLLAASCMLLAGNLQAAMVNFTISGTVLDNPWTTDPNPFGLGAGDNITVSGTYDNGGLTGSGDESVSFGLGSGNSMTLYVGSITYTEVDDGMYSSGFPQLLFNDGLFNGVNFETDFFADIQFSAGGDSLVFWGYDSTDLDFPGINGEWDAGSFTATVVPVPAAVWLLGSGLLGLVGLARRKARA